MTHADAKPVGPEENRIAEAFRQMGADREDDTNPTPGCTPGQPPPATPKGTAYIVQRFLREKVWPRGRRR